MFKKMLKKALISQFMVADKVGYKLNHSWCIKWWLNVYNKEKAQYEIKKCDDELIVDVIGNVDISMSDAVEDAIARMMSGRRTNSVVIEHVPFKFGVIQGNFKISHQYFKSLDFLPEKVIGNFEARNCRLDSIILPQVTQSINLQNNHLTEINLEGQIAQEIDLSFNNLIKIEANYPMKRLWGNHNQLIDFNVKNCQDVSLYQNLLEDFILPENCERLVINKNPIHEKYFKEKNMEQHEIIAYFHYKQITDSLIINDFKKKTIKI